MVDVYDLTNLLRQLNFKVVSLLDLTESEMRNAVDEFLLLLHKGVYGGSSVNGYTTCLKTLQVSNERPDKDEGFFLIKHGFLFRAAVLCRSRLRELREQFHGAGGRAEPVQVGQLFVRAEHPQTDAGEGNGPECFSAGHVQKEVSPPHLFNIIYSHTILIMSFIFQEYS